MDRKQLFRTILDFVNLEKEILGFEQLHSDIQKDVIFKGTNLWILVLAVIIASLGLNVNSPAVIIGAMLISPLMGPINGMGYSLATYNFPLFRQAVKNFSFAILAGLLASSVYFTLSPISTAHSEILARTSPTIYDVLIAFFGGFAGIVAISSKQKGNVIPGVAIATALIPPLCTAGYGLASAQAGYFLGAIYLFTINTAFIAFSAMIVTRILKFPVRAVVSEQKKKKINQLISLTILVVLIPSIYFGYRLVQQEKFTERSNRFVNDISVFEGNYLLKNIVDPARKKITLIYGGTPLSEAQKSRILEKTKNFKLDGANLEFKQGLTFDAQIENNTELERLRSELTNMQRQNLVESRKLDSLSQINLIGKQMFNEISMIFPQIIACTYSESLEYSKEKSKAKNVAILLLFYDTARLTEIEKNKIRNWVKARTGHPMVYVCFEKRDKKAAYPVAK